MSNLACRHWLVLFLASLPEQMPVRAPWPVLSITSTWRRRIFGASDPSLRMSWTRLTWPAEWQKPECLWFSAGWLDSLGHAIGSDGDSAVVTGIACTFVGSGCFSGGLGCGLVDSPSLCCSLLYSSVGLAWASVTSTAILATSVCSSACSLVCSSADLACAWPSSVYTSQISPWILGGSACFFAWTSVSSSCASVWFSPDSTSFLSGWACLLAGMACSSYGSAVLWLVQSVPQPTFYQAWPAFWLVESVLQLVWPVCQPVPWMPWPVSQFAPGMVQTVLTPWITWLMPQPVYWHFWIASWLICPVPLPVP